MVESTFSDRNEQHRMAHPRILKISEMALSLDGVYLGEVGNSGASPEDMFHWNPLLGLKINVGRNKTVELSPDDVVSLPDALGYVPLEHLLSQSHLFSNKRVIKQAIEQLLSPEYMLSSDPLTPNEIELCNRFLASDVLLADTRLLTQLFSEREVIMTGGMFEMLRYQEKEHTEKRIAMIRSMAQITGQTYTDSDVDGFKDRAPKEYSPEQLLESMLKGLRNPQGWDKQLSLSEAINATGVLDADIQKSREGIVSYCELWMRIKNVDMTTPDDVIKELENFPYFGELLKEYKRKPDSRFSSALLLALEQFAKESSNAA